MRKIEETSLPIKEKKEPPGKTKGPLPILFRGRGGKWTADSKMLYHFHEGKGGGPAQFSERWGSRERNLPFSQGGRGTREGSKASFFED